MAKKPTLQIPAMTPEQRGFVAGARPGHNVVERPAALHDASQRPETPHDVAKRPAVLRAPKGLQDVAERLAASHDAPQHPATSHNVVERSAASQDVAERPAPARAAKAVVVWASGEERRRRTVYLRTETDDALEDYRKANRYPASEVIEEAVREYLRARGALT